MVHGNKSDSYPPSEVVDKDECIEFYVWKYILSKNKEKNKTTNFYF